MRTHLKRRRQCRLHKCRRCSPLSQPELRREITRRQYREEEPSRQNTSPVANLDAGNTATAESSCKQRRDSGPFQPRCQPTKIYIQRQRRRIRKTHCQQESGQSSHLSRSSHLMQVSVPAHPRMQLYPSAHKPDDHSQNFSSPKECDKSRHKGGLLRT